MLRPAKRAPVNLRRGHRLEQLAGVLPAVEEVVIRTEIITRIHMTVAIDKLVDNSLRALVTEAVLVVSRDRAIVAIELAAACYKQSGDHSASTRVFKTHRPLRQRRMTVRSFQGTESRRGHGQIVQVAQQPLDSGIDQVPPIMTAIQGVHQTGDLTQRPRLAGTVEGLQHRSPPAAEIR